MTQLSEHERCELTRAYHRSITCDQRKQLAARYGLTLSQLHQLAAGRGAR